MTTTKKVKKEFALSNLAVNNKTSVYVLIFIILISGLSAYNTMPKESFPEIVQPTVYIGTSYPGNSPLDMENLVTRPIEKELKSLNGVKKFTSTSIQDYSTIIVEFDLDVPTQKALQDVKDAVDKAKKELPNDLPQDPNVFELDFSEFPVMNINLSGNFTYDEFREYAEYFQEEMEKLPEISSVDIRGLLEKEVKINVDLHKMESMKISFNDIENAISSENLTMSAGDILSIKGDNYYRRSLRIDGEFQSVEELYNVIVKDENQRIVYLRDIAEVEFGPVEPTSFARMDGNPVVMLDIKKKSGENLIRAAEGIQRILNESIGKNIPSDLKVVITNDQSNQTKSMVSNLENSIISGIILVVLVLLFFLGLRNSLFVGIAIPLSMLMGIAILNFQGATLNMMVLFSLILALGMLVDNGIVVVENIYRKFTEERLPLLQASKEGVGEVAIPIIASTATTLAAFLPLLFWKDLIGEFMKFLPLTLIIVLTSSLFVALVINPVLTANFMQDDSKKANTDVKKFWTSFGIMMTAGIILIFTPVRWIGSLLVIFSIFGLLYRFALRPAAEKFQNSVMTKLEKKYEQFVKFALKGYNPLFIFVGTLFLLVGSIVFFNSTNPKFLFFPENEPRNVNIYIEMPLGTDILRTNEVAKEVERRVNKAIQPNLNIVDAVLTQVGEGTGDPSEGPQMGSSPNKAKVTVAFINYDKRVKVNETPTSKVMEDIRQAVENMPEALITVEKNREGPPVGKPINIEISGDNFDSLIVISERMIKFLEDANVPGVDQLKVDLETNKPEVLIKINSDAARRFGVSKYAISMALRTALFGKEISKYKEGEDDYKIQLRLKDVYRYDISKLMNIKITFRDPATGRIVQVPVSALVELEYGTTYGSVRRKDMERVVNIFSGVKEGYNANEIVAKYKKLLESFSMPEGYTMKFTGEQEEQAKSSEFLTNAFLIAFLLIFLIIVSQFNSIISPLIIMFSVIFSTIGVFLGFGIFKMDFVILMCGIGIISLAGVVVNNAIVLIDYTNLLRTNKRKELGIEENEYLPKDVLLETITEAGRTRLRPVLLTAITTILGLIPLATGMNIDFIGLLNNFDPDFYTGGDNVMFWGPMSWTVIFGLTFATFLTLVVVPVMYILADKITRRMKSLF